MKKVKLIERIRRYLIRKLGGFVIYPPSQEHILVRSTTVEPEPFEMTVSFSPDQLYDVTPENIQIASEEKIQKALLVDLRRHGQIEMLTSQDKETGVIKVTARMWVISPITMRKAKEIYESH